MQNSWRMALLCSVAFFRLNSQPLTFRIPRHEKVFRICFCSLYAKRFVCYSVNHRLMPFLVQSSSVFFVTFHSAFICISHLSYITTQTTIYPLLIFKSSQKSREWFLFWIGFFFFFLYFSFIYISFSFFCNPYLPLLSINRHKYIRSITRRLCMGARLFYGAFLSQHIHQQTMIFWSIFIRFRFGSDLKRRMNESFFLLFQAFGHQWKRVARSWVHTNRPTE